MFKLEHANYSRTGGVALRLFDGDREMYEAALMVGAIVAGTSLESARDVPCFAYKTRFGWHRFRDGSRQGGMNGVWRPRDVSAGSDTKSLLFETDIERKLDA